VEIGFNCYSVAFGPDLIPGMFGPPIDAIPKHHSDKLWLINDQVWAFIPQLMDQRRRMVPCDLTTSRLWYAPTSFPNVPW